MEQRWVKWIEGKSAFVKQACHQRSETSIDIHLHFDLWCLRLLLWRILFYSVSTTFALSSPDSLLTPWLPNLLCGQSNEGDVIFFFCLKWRVDRFCRRKMGTGGAAQIYIQQLNNVVQYVRHRERRIVHVFLSEDCLNCIYYDGIWVHNTQSSIITCQRNFTLEK